MIPVFDGHNDFLQRLVAAPPEQRGALWHIGDGTGHLDLARMKSGGFAGGFFAIWIPLEAAGKPGRDTVLQFSNPPYRLEPSPEIACDAALPHAFEQAAALMALERTGTLTVCRDAAMIDTAMSAGRIAAIMHMEGSEAIADMDALHLWHAAGLRSLGLVWSRPTRYAHGVPFAFPSSPDIGDGLTPAGYDLVRECNALRIMIDLSHLNEKGMDDVARLSTAPLVASHSCAHAIAPSSRNLTDRQLHQIRDSGGLVGLNYAVNFLRPDARREPFSGFDPILRHLDHLLGILGEEGVALGSDFDGAVMPADLADAAALPGLIEAMRAHGYDEPLIERIAWRNWVELLRRIWGG